MSGFGPNYRRLDEAGAQPLLDYLDEMVDVPLVAQAKAAATAALALRPGERVLELGCGTGVDLPALLETGADVVGCDPSRAAIAAARERVGAAAELVVAAAEALPFDAASFDACRTDRTLQHVPDPEAALREIRRVVRPGGRLVVLEMGMVLEDGLGDLPLSREIAERMWPLDEQGWSALMLPLLVHRTGWAGAELHQASEVSGELADVDRALRLKEALSEAVGDGTVSADDARRWRAGLERSAAAGTLRLHVHTVRLAARA